MIDHSLVTGFTMFIRRSFDMTCFGISTYHRHEPPLRRLCGSSPFAFVVHRGGHELGDSAPPDLSLALLLPRSRRGQPLELTPRTAPRSRSCR